MRRNLLSLASLLCLATACTHEPSMVSIGLDDAYAIVRMKALRLHPEYTGERYEWHGITAAGNDTIVATTRDYVFISATTGEFPLTLRIIDAENPVEHSMTITVWEEEVSYSRYITTVYDYSPAPGQHINVVPMYEEGDTPADMSRKAQECIAGTRDEVVSLGGYGGSITFGFDHTVVNVPGELDFKILGNAFYGTGMGSRGSAEPGIVMVAFDANGNGEPDDAWYELAGSEYYKPETRHNYTITYYRPAADHVATPIVGTAVNDSSYIRWSDSEGRSGYIARNMFHSQEYFPGWMAGESITYTGTCLAPNAVDESGSGTNYVLTAYDYGYADNHPNDEEAKISFDIAWAVDSEGNPVHLPGADFVRVYTGVNQQCGWIGETSTEICRAEDLHVAE